MSEKPKRRWFQFHLLTAVLMALTTGFVIPVTFKEHRIVVSAGSLGLLGYRAHGWPFIMQQRLVNWFSEPDYDRLRSELAPVNSGYRNLSGFFVDGDGQFSGEWSIVGISLNALIVLVVVSIVAFVSESLIRRREGRQS